jgi:ABC-type glycerol-3-phosphate transport system substrate-binding protein
VTTNGPSASDPAGISTTDISRRSLLKFAGLLAIAGPTALTACSSSAASNSSASSAGATNPASFKGVTLNVGCNPTDVQAAQAAGKIWAEKYGVTVNAQVIPYAERATDYATMIVSKDPHYDVLFGSVDFVSNFGDKIYLDLGDLGGGTSDLLPAALGQLSKGGKLYAAPLFADMEFFIYNKKLWTTAGLDPSKIPTTWDEMFALTPQLLSTGKDANATPWTSIGVPYWISFYNSLGGKLFNEDKTELLFDNDQALQTWQTIEKGFQTKFFGTAGNSAAGDADTEILFNQGLAASEINTVGFWAQTRSNDPQYKVQINKDDVGVTIMPGITSGKSGSIIVSEGFGVNKFGKNQDAALAFVKYMSGPEFQKQLVLGQAGTVLPPASISVGSDPDVKAAFPIAPLLAEQAKSQLTWPGNAPYNWNAPFLLGITNLSKGTWTAQQAHTETVKAVQQLIVQYIAA